MAFGIDYADFCWCFLLAILRRFWNYGLTGRALVLLAWLGWAWYMDARIGLPLSYLTVYTVARNRV